MPSGLGVGDADLPHLLHVEERHGSRLRSGLRGDEQGRDRDGDAHDTDPAKADVHGTLQDDEDVILTELGARRSALEAGGWKLGADRYNVHR